MQRKYEAMFLLRPDLTEEKRNEVFSQISDAILKNEGKVISASVWGEKRKLAYPIKKYKEGLYYFVQFNALASAIEKLRAIYRLNENILRILTLKIDRASQKSFSP